MAAINGPVAATSDPGGRGGGGGGGGDGLLHDNIAQNNHSFFICPNGFWSSVFYIKAISFCPYGYVITCNGFHRQTTYTT